MVNQDLGRVCLVPQGAYDPEAAYTRLDAVSYNGSCYMVRKACQGVTPAEGEYYMLMADGSVALAAAARADEAAASARQVVDTVMPDVKQIKTDVENLEQNKISLDSGNKFAFRIGLDEGGLYCITE